MATSIEYAELKARTCFSFLRGASHPEELVRRAARLGLRALGVVDLNGVYGIPKAYQARKEFPGLKLLVGAELSISGGRRLSFLARDRAAYGLLCRMITAAHDGRPKGGAELGFSTLLDHWLARPEARGLVTLADPEALGARGGDATGRAPDSGSGSGADSDLIALSERLGGNLSLLLFRFKDGRDRERTERALAMGRRLGAKVVASNDVHYHIRARHELQDVMTAIRSGRSLADSGFRLFSNAERYLKSPERMGRLFADLPKALRATLEVAESCAFCPSELRYRYPSEWIPRGHDARSYLEELTWKGARERYGLASSDPAPLPVAVRGQLERELGLIARLGFADYFLTIHEIVEFARSRDILCQGRGSAANSAVCYCLGITAIDPVRMDLLFERFISEERGEPPDIDLDFEHERREEVIQHIYEKYGRDRAAMVSAVVTYRPRSAFREVCKALGVEVGASSARELRRRFAEVSARTGIPDCGTLAERLAAELEGMPRHLSIHSGGFTLSADPIIEIVPREPARMEGRTIIQWDKYDLDYLGLLKVDVLALGMLSALRKTLQALGVRLHEIPPEDPGTYAMIQRADTVGTFQIESRAQMSMLGRLLPRTFYDLVIQVAIVRPGPIVGRMVHPYLRRRRGEEPILLPDPRLRKILGRTLGVPLFQEQVMKLAIQLAGFTPGEADELRRAIGAWRSTGSMEKMGLRLMEGLTRSGLPPEFARRTFEQIQGFAMYGFPESHAASFALLAYASAYLKCHHPAEFTCALLNSQPMGFYSSHTLVNDARGHGVEIRPVHPARSGWDCQVEEPGALRLGLRVVRGLSRSEAARWITERDARPFAGLRDFVLRARLRLDVLQRLAMAGAFECFGRDPRDAFWEILQWRALMEPAGSPQLSFFELAGFREASASRCAPSQAAPPFASLSPVEAVREEFEAYGLSSRTHPMPLLRKKLGLVDMTTERARNLRPGSRTGLAGLVIVRQRPPTARGVSFATLEDETGFLDLVLHPPVFERYREEYLEHCFLLVHGVIQKDTHAVNLIVSRLKPIELDWAVDPRQYFNPLPLASAPESAAASQGRRMQVRSHERGLATALSVSISCRVRARP